MKPKLTIQDAADTLEIVVQRDASQMPWELVMLGLTCVWMYKYGLSAVGIAVVVFLAWLDATRVTRRTFSHQIC